EVWSALRQVRPRLSAVRSTLGSVAASLLVRSLDRMTGRAGASPRRDATQADHGEAQVHLAGARAGHAVAAVVHVGAAAVHVAARASRALAQVDPERSIRR